MAVRCCPHVSVYLCLVWIIQPAVGFTIAHRRRVRVGNRVDSFRYGLKCDYFAAFQYMDHKSGMPWLPVTLGQSGKTGPG